MLFDTLLKACLKDNADLIIAGDLFDKSHPTLQEQDIVFRFFKELERESITTTIVGGNHETIANGEDTFKYLSSMVPDNVWLARTGCIQHKQYNTMLHLLSHCDLPKNVDEYADSMENLIDDSNLDRHILITHFRTTVGEYVREEINTDKLCSPFCLVIAGDIHTEHKQGNLVYCNQPINSAFASEAKTSYLVLTLEEDGASYNWVPTKLPALIQWNNDAADYDDLCGYIDDHFRKNDSDMGGRDFIKINMTGSLKDLRSIGFDNPNVKLNKIPLVEDTVVEEVSTKDSLEIMTTDMQLIEYLKLVPYTEENIHSLLEIWKEVVS